MREASPTKTLTEERAAGPGKSLWSASHLVPPNAELSVRFKKNTARERTEAPGGSGSIVFF